MQSVKSFLAGSVLAVSALLFQSGQLTAQDYTPVPAAVGESTGPVQFAGIENDMLLFDMRVNSLPAKGAILSIYDADGNTIFTERLTAADTNRRYKIVRGETTSRLTFKLSGKAVFFSEAFTLNYKVEEKWEVKKVK